MKKTAVSLSLTLLLAGCGPTATQPAPVPTPTPTPSATASPVFQGETTLSGTVALEAQSVVIEASNATGTFRKSTDVSNQRYTLTGVPVGERIRVQAQYRNNPFVTLSALIDVGADRREQNTPLNLDLGTTATELIYAQAAAKGLSKIVTTPVASFGANTALTPYHSRVRQVLEELFATPIDAILVNVATAPRVLQTLDDVLPAIDALLQNQPVPVPTPTPVVSGTPGPTPTGTPNPGFNPTRLVLRPGAEVTIARDTSLRVAVAAADNQNRQEVVTPNWVRLSANGEGNMDPSGVFTPSTSGTFTYTANYNGLSATLTIRVTEGELNSLEMIPDEDFSLTVNQPFQLLAKGRDDRGNEVTVTPNWSLSNDFVARVDLNGNFTPLQAGRVDITARAREYSATVTVTVESSSVFLIESTPREPVVLTGKVQPLQILAVDTSNNTASTAFNFSVADPSVGSFLGQDTSINGITPTALFQGLKPGTTQVTVRDILTNRTTTFPITVADGVPFISGISPASSPLTTGQTITLSGENFSTVPGGNQILFNNIPGTVISATSNSLLATVPVGAFTGFITVISDGRRGGSLPFVLTPQISSLIPAEAGEGELVTITGQGFSTDNPIHNAVFFGSERASIPVNVTNSSLQVRVPANVGSDVQVSVRVKGAISNFREFDVAGSSLPNWTDEADAPTSRSGAMAEQIDGKIYVLGGNQSSSSDRLEIFDISDEDWTRGADLPTERSRMATAVIDDEIYVIGGNGGSNRIDRYNTDDDEWTELDIRTEENHVGAVAEAYQGKLYIIGGEGSSGRVVEECDPDASDEDEACEVKQNSPSRRYESASALYNGRIYVIGGGENSAEDRITAYDIEEDEWIVGLAPMPKRLRRAGAVVINSKIYVIGGQDETGEQSDAVYEYTPSSDSWRTLRRLPSARSGPAVASISSRIYVIGGENSNGGTTDTLFRGAL